MGSEAWKKVKTKKYSLEKGLLAAWGIPSGIMLLLFIMNGIFPFGDRSFLFSDMYHQYMPFFSEFMEKVKAGESLYYSWNVGIGSNFLALYVYYLASPLHWLAFMFPQEYLMEFMSYLVIIKIGLCGLTFCYYLRRHFNTHSVTTVLFSVFYALSGFMAAYNWNIMWLDCIWLFPLILWGLEKLVREGRPMMYCITLALSILTNYYISIMICIFLVLYFITLILTNEHFLKPIWQFTVYSLLAGGLAAVLLVPEVCAIWVTDFGAMEFPEKIESYFSILDELARHQLCISTERGLDHWPNIYCGVAVLWLVPLFAVNEKISAKRRFAMLGLAGILLISFSTNILDFIWHGLNYPDSLPARQSFIYIFLILVMCYEAFLHIRALERRTLVNCFLAAVVFLLFCEKFVEHEDFAAGIEVLTLVFLAIYGVLLYYYHGHQEREWKAVLCIVAFLVAGIETGINTFNTSVGTVSRTDYLSQLGDYQALYEYADEQTEGFLRMEKFMRKTKNDGTLAGYPTASLFSSTMNSNVANFYEKLGMRHSKVYYGFDGATGLTSALLNINYMFGDTEDAQQNEANVKTDRLYTAVAESGDITLYECNYTLPFGYVVPADYELPEIKTNEPLKLQNEIVDSLGVNSRLFTRVDVSRKEDNVVLEATANAYYYMVVSASGTARIDAIGDFGTKNFKDLKNGCVLYVGYLKKGQTVEFTNGDEGDETPNISLTAYRMNTETLQEVLDKLSEQHMEYVSYDDTHIEGYITMEEAGQVVLSVPYEAGWSVRVNEKEVETGLFGNCFMTVTLEPGEYKITMDYDPKGRKEGILLSLVSLVLLAALVVLERKRPEEETVEAAMEEAAEAAMEEAAMEEAVKETAEAAMEEAAMEEAVKETAAAAMEETVKETAEAAMEEAVEAAEAAVKEDAAKEKCRAEEEIPPK